MFFLIFPVGMLLLNTLLSIVTLVLQIDIHFEMYSPSRPKSRRALNPPGCSNSPTILSGSFRSLSITVTFLPSLESTVAKEEPRTPDPTMIISGSYWGDNVVFGTVSVRYTSEKFTSLLPFRKQSQQSYMCQWICTITLSRRLTLEHSEPVDWGCIGSWKASSS